jgi:hypothetical protein
MSVIAGMPVVATVTSVVVAITPVVAGGPVIAAVTSVVVTTTPVVAAVTSVVNAVNAVVITTVVAEARDAVATPTVEAATLRIRTLQRDHDRGGDRDAQ